MTRRISVAVFCLLAIILGGFVRTKMPDAASALSQPYVYSETAPRFGTVTNLSTSATREVRGVRTTGVFLRVAFDFTPNVRSTSPTATLIDAQQRTIASYEFTLCQEGQNGLTNACEAIFEVDPQALEGAKVRFTPGFTETGSAVIVKDLGIDEARAQQLQEEAR